MNTRLPYTEASTLSQHETNLRPDSAHPSTAQLTTAVKAERRAAALLNGVMNNACEGLITADGQGIIQSFNPVCEHLFAFRAQEVIGTPVTNLLMSGDVQLLTELINRRPNPAAGPYPTIREVHGVNKRGRLIDLEMAVSKFSLPDNETALLITFHDISNRVAARDSLQVAEADLEATNTRLEILNVELATAKSDLSDLTHAVSHDLRSPLVNLIGFSSELRDMMKGIVDRMGPGGEMSSLEGLNAKDVPKVLEFVNSAGDKLQSRLETVVRLSRIGLRELRPSRVSLAQVFDSVLISLDEHEAAVTLRVDDVPELRIDEDSIYVLATQLLSNAIKYGAKDRPLEVLVTARVEDADLIISVKDNGRGIRPDDYGRIFKLFQRVGRIDTVGEGVGLAFCQRVAIRLCGSIWCESVLGEGSNFFLRLPLTRPTSSDDNVLAFDD